MSEKLKKPATSLDDLKARLGLTGETTKVSDPSEQSKTAGDPPKEPPPPVPNLPPLPKEPAASKPEAVEAPSRAKPKTPEVAEKEAKAKEKREPAPKKDPPPKSSEPTPEKEAVSSAAEKVGDSEEDVPVDRVASAAPAPKKEEPSLHVPVSSTTKMAFIGGVIILFLLTLMFGYLFGSVKRDRMVATEVVNETAHMLQLIFEGQGEDDRSTTARRLEDFHNALSEFGDDYGSPGEHAELYQSFMLNGGDIPFITSRQLEGAKILLTTTEGHVGQLVDYALATQLLGSMIQEHIESTAQDQSLGNFERLLSGESSRQYLVHFDNPALGRAYDEFVDIETPELSQFNFPLATVIPYDRLELANTGDSSEPRYVFRVSEAESFRGELRPYNVLGITLEQLLVTGTEETALDRYAHRTSAIREKLVEIMHTQQQLHQSLRDRVSAVD